MKRKPQLFVWIAALLFLQAALFPLSTSFEAGWEMERYFALMTDKHLSVYLACLTCLWGSLCALKASPLFLVITPLSFVLVTWQSQVLQDNIASPQGVYVASTSLILVLSQSLYFFPKTRNLFQNPERRWWLTPSRVRIKMNASLHDARGRLQEAETENLSTTGALLRINNSGISPLDQHLIGAVKGIQRRDHAIGHLSVDSDNTQFEIGKQFVLRLSVRPMQSLYMRGEVVRIDQMPNGSKKVAFRFIDAPRKSRRSIEGLVERLRPRQERAVA